MKTYGKAGLILSLGLLSSCTTPFFQHYALTGTMNGNQPYVGTIDNDPLDAKAIITMKSIDGNVHCVGKFSRVVFQDNATLSCDMAQGSIVLECTKLNAPSPFPMGLVLSWDTNDCASGYGHGYTESGDVFYFSFYPERQKPFSVLSDKA